MEFFYEIDNVKDYLSINSNSNICDNILLNNFDDNKFKFGQINTIENKLEISYYSPINFYLYLDIDEKLFISLNKIYKSKKINYIEPTI